MTRLLQLGSIVLLALLPMLSVVNFTSRDVRAAETNKPAWQVEWEKTLDAAKKEGQVTVYISGYEEVLPDFQRSTRSQMR
jgi:hypothetical protein